MWYYRFKLGIYNLLTFCFPHNYSGPDFYQFDPRRSYLLSAVQVCTTTHCLFCREQLGSAPPKAGPVIIHTHIFTRQKIISKKRVVFSTTYMYCISLNIWLHILKWCLFIVQCLSSIHQA